jgi:alpha-tubulin suppressor-like RCC1 family protein
LHRYHLPKPFLTRPAAVTDRGELWTWGFNEKGQLGLGHRFNQEFPKKVALEAMIVEGKPISVLL